MSDSSSRVVEPNLAEATPPRRSPAMSPDLAQHAIENIAQGLIVTDGDWRLEYVNPAFARMAGRRPEELIGLVVSDLVVDADLASYRQAQAQRLAGLASSYELRLKGADGAEIPVLVTGVPRLHTSQFAGTIALVTDSAERKRAERQLLHVNRALAVLKECNQVLVRADNEADLLRRMCEIIVTVGGYRMAWVGLARHDPEKSVFPAAQFGFEAGYLDQARISWADTERGRGPTGLAIMTGTTQVNQDFLHNPATRPWRAQAIQRGYQSSIALPLRDQRSTFGALTIYAARPDAFDAEEVLLLGELADDLAYGIAALHDTAERRRAEEEIRRLCAELEQRVKDRTLELAESDARFRLALTHAPVSVATQDRDFRFTWAYNQRTIAASEILGKTDADLFSPEDAARLITLKRRVLDTGETVRDQLWITSNGQRVFLDLFLEPIVDEHGAVAGVGIATVDLTNVKLAEKALRQSESKYRIFFENLAETITIFEAIRDSRGAVVDWKIQDANQVMLRAMGLASEEFLSRRVTQVFAGADLAEDLDRYRRALERGESSVQDRMIGDRDFIVSVFRLDDNRVAAVGMDITERKRAQEQMRAAVSDLTRFNRAMIGRELRMLELKQEVNALCQACGRPARYLLEREREAL